MYLSNYYAKQARNALRGISDGTQGNILSVKDADSTIMFTNNNEVAKVYKSMYKDSNQIVQDMCYKYNSYKASPRQVGEKGSLPLSN